MDVYDDIWLHALEDALKARFATKTTRWSMVTLEVDEDEGPNVFRAQ